MLFFNSLLVFTLLFLCPSDTFAKMYKWVDKAGKTHFSDNPPNPENTARDLKEFESIEDNNNKKEEEAMLAKWAIGISILSLGFAIWSWYLSWRDVKSRQLEDWTIKVFEAIRAKLPSNDIPHAAGLSGLVLTWPTIL